MHTGWLDTCFFSEGRFQQIMKGGENPFEELHSSFGEQSVSGPDGSGYRPYDELLAASHCWLEAAALMVEGQGSRVSERRGYVGESLRDAYNRAVVSTTKELSLQHTDEGQQVNYANSDGNPQPWLVRQNQDRLDHGRQR